MPGSLVFYPHYFKQTMGATLAYSVVKVGGEFLVKTETEFFVDQPNVAGLANGGFVVTWTDVYTSHDDGSSDIKAQLFDASGAEVGGVFLVNTQTAKDQSASSITGLANGGFLVTWTDYSGEDNSSGLGEIKAQVFDSTGAKVNGEFQVNTTTNSTQYYSTITELAKGGFVVTWVDYSTWLIDGDLTNIRAQVFDASGAKMGGEFLVNTQTAGTQVGPQITALADGGFVVTWHEGERNVDGGSGTLGDSSGTSVNAQVFDATGAKVGEELLVNTKTADNQFGPMTTALANGGFVVTWTDQIARGSSRASVKAQVFGASGAKVGGELLIHEETAGGQRLPTITGLASGGFVVTWNDSGYTLGDDSNESVLAQAFDASGAKLGDAFLVNSVTAGLQFRPKISGLNDGGFVVAWDNNGFGVGDSGPGLKAQIFQVYNAITGTDSKDSLSGTDSADQILGLDGNDTLTGLAGNDLLDGGAGNDRMVGGTGDDIYVVDAAGDRVVENASEGSDTAKTALAAYMLGRNVENLTFTNALAHSGTGNGLANHITGGRGADIIDGRAGADTMEGGSGGDTYYVDNARDVVIEVKRGGQDSVIATVSTTLSSEVENLTLANGKAALTATAGQCAHRQ